MVFKEDASAVVTNLRWSLLLVDKRETPAAPRGGPGRVLEDPDVDARELDRQRVTTRLQQLGRDTVTANSFVASKSANGASSGFRANIQ